MPCNKNLVTQVRKEQQSLVATNKDRSRDFTDRLEDNPMNTRKYFVIATVVVVLAALFVFATAMSPQASSQGNTAPVLDNSGSPTLNAGFQNHFDPPGTRVADMLATGASGDPISDPDLGGVDGVAVVAVDNSHGTWQFSTDNGSNWSNFPAPPFPAHFNLSSLNAARGLAINGSSVDEQSGWSVSNAGDVNGDGLDDVIIGANQASPNSRGYAGASYVIFGTAQGGVSTLNLNSLDGSNGFALNGIDPSDFSGHAVSGAGDVNDDGYDDVLIGAIQADPGGRSSAGEVYVVFGSGAFSATLNLDNLNGSNGFVVHGINSYEESDKAGYAVSDAGDVNNDGIDDFIIGAPFADPGEVYDSGQSYVIFGTGSGFPATLELSALNGSNGFAINGIGQSDWAGFSVSGAGDVNGDNYDDVIIGATDADPGSKAQAGEAYVVFGGSSFSASFNLSSLNGSNGFTLNGEAEWDRTGWSVSDAGDINGDGRDDVLVSAPESDNGNTDSGKSYVLFGSAAFSGTINLGALNGSDGFALKGINDSDFSGQSVSGVGDLNADGIDDLIIGANKADPNSNNAAGETYVLFGSNDPFAATVNLADLYGFNGISANDETGFTVSGAGDFDGDGLTDLLIGAPHSSAGAANGGQSYIIIGRPLATTLTATPNDRIRFVPDTGFTGAAHITFRAWDTTDGHNSGDTGVEIAGTGGAFAYSTAMEQATITILPAPPDLALDKSITPTGLVLPGQTVTYTVVFSNGGAVSASNVVITDLIPVALTGTTVTSSGVPLTPLGGQDYAWSVGSLAVNDGGTITIVGQVDPALSADTSFTNQATLAGSNLEAFTNNNTGTVNTNVALPRVYFDTSTFSVNETDGSATITARLSIASSLEIMVDYATVAGGSATAGSDYTAISGTLIFSPGSTVQTFTVPILDDFLDDANETINLELSSPSRALLSSPQNATLTILNDDITITGLNATNDGPTASGSATGLNATIATGNDVTYAWDFGDGQSGSGASVSHTYGALGSYTAVVTATNAVNQVTAGTTVIVRETISGLAAFNNSPQELGQPTTVSTTISAGTDVTYAWSFGNGQNGSGAVTNHTYGSVGTFNATVTANNGVSSQMAQTTVTIVDAPITGLTAGNNSPKEQGQAVSLWAGQSAGSNVTYSWDFGDGQSGSGVNVNHTYSTLGIYTATVTASNSVSNLVAQTIVTVTDVPVAGLAVTNDSPQIHGQTTSIFVSTSAGSNIVYTWDLGDGPAPYTGGTSDTYIYPAPGDYTVTVTATNGMGSWAATSVVTILPRTCWARLNNDPTDYYYVQDAVDAATQPTDVVKVAGYCDSVFSTPAYNDTNFVAKQSVVLAKTLTLRGGYTHTNWSSYNWTANPSTLDATHLGRVMYVTSNAQPTIEGLTLTGGNAATLGGSAVADVGGGVFVNKATPTFVHNKILTNTAEQGGGMWLMISSAVISDNLFAGNTASGTDGGGLYLYHGAPTVINNTLTGNGSIRFGGGMYLYRGSAQISDNLVDNNNAQGGGGLYAWDTSATLRDNTFRANNATTTGGGTYLSSSGADLLHNIFNLNTAQLGGGLYLYRDSSDFNGNTFTGNSAGGTGGGIFINDSDVLLANSFIINNMANSKGSGIHILSSAPTLAHSTIADNSNGDGVGIYIASGASTSSNVQFYNTILVKHPVGIYAEDGSDTANMGGTLWGSGSWANTTDTGGAGTINTGAANLWVAPDFVDAPGGDYHITESSPAIDQGVVSGTPNDFDLSHRPSGGGYDLGADEIPLGLNVVHFAGPNPVEPGAGLTYTLLVTNVDTVDHPVTIVYSPSPHVSPNTVQTWTPTLTASGGSWSIQLPSTANSNAVGPMVSTLQATTDQNDTFINTYSVDVERAVTNLVLTNDSPTIPGSITNMTAGADGDNISYAWAFGDGQISAGPVVTNIYPAVGNYTVVVTAGNSVSAVTDTMTVVVEKVIDGLQVDYESPVAKDQSTTLTASVTNGTNVSYSWDFGDGNSGSGAAVDHTYTAVGFYHPVVTAGNNVSSMTATVTIKVQEAVQGLVAGSSSPTEFPQTTAFSATITAGSSVSYQWNFGDGSSGSGANPSHTYAAVGVYNATVIASNGVSNQSANTVVTVFNSPPNAVLSLDVTTGTIEMPVTADAGASSDPNNDDLTYTFNFGGERIIGPQASPIASYTFMSGGNHAVQVTVGDGLATDVATRFTDLLAVPRLKIGKIGPSTVYVGDIITYTLTITNMTLPSGSSPSAVLQVDPGRLYFSATEGGSQPPAQNFNISNGGTGNLVWLIRKNAGWLTLSATDGSGTASITASADISGLAPGVYTEQIVVDAGLAQNGLQTIDAVLTIYCTNRQPVDVMLALDKSGSMWGTPFANAQDAVKGFIDQMDLATDQVGLVSFNSLATVNHTLTQNGGAVKTTVDSLNAGGMTNIAEAINDAHSELLSTRHNTSNTPVIILLSDGSQTVAGDPLAEAAQAKADGIRIISIGMGYANTNVLQAVASSPGDYYYAPTSADLNHIYNMIAVSVGCPGGTQLASFNVKSAEKHDPYAPVFRTMPAAPGVAQDSGTAYNVVITDVVPSGATYVGGGTLTEGEVGWTLPELPPNTSVELVFAVTAQNTIVNEDYGVRADDGFVATGSGAVTTVVSPRPVPAISISKSASTNFVVGAQEVVYSYEVTNIGTAVLENIAVDDDILGFVGGKETLVPNQTWVVTKAGLIVEDTTNVATVNATSQFGPASDTAGAYVDFTPDWLCGATIASVGDGNWKDASTWEPARIPRNDDIVLVQDGHAVTVQAAARTNIRALCNYGILRSTNKQQIHIKTDEFLFNYGTIESTDGAGGPDRTCGHPANDLKLTGSPITNWGYILGGNGGDGAQCGGRGGSVMVKGRNTTNCGTICAGEGGKILGTSKGKRGHAGKGGFTTVWGNHGGPGMLKNTGLICAGDGGDGNPAATGKQNGGDGGDLRLNSEPDVILSGGRYYAGEGGNGTGGGNDGRDGRVFIEPMIISLSGPNTEVKGGDIIIFGGDDWVLDLSNMNGAAIEASGNITLAVGSGSSVDLRNNGNGSGVLKAGGEVFVAADTVLVDSGTTVSDVTGNNVTVGGSQIFNDVSVNAPALVEGQVNSSRPITLTVINGGPLSDRYTLSQSSTEGWSLTGLPGTIDLEGLTSGELTLNVAVPDTAQSGDINEITLVAQSQNDPDLTVSTIVEVEVSGGASGGSYKVFIPLVLK